VRVAAGLERPELVVLAALFQQLRVRTFLHEPALLEHQDAVGVLHRSQPVAAQPRLATVSLQKVECNHG